MRVSSFNICGTPMLFGTKLRLLLGQRIEPSKSIKRCWRTCLSFSHRLPSNKPSPLACRPSMRLKQHNKPRLPNSTPFSLPYNNMPSVANCSRACRARQGLARLSKHRKRRAWHALHIILTFCRRLFLYREGEKKSMFFTPNNSSATSSRLLSPAGISKSR